MSKSVNKTTLLGHVGKDPDVRVLPSNSTVANFTLATNEFYRDNTGETHETTEWHNLVAFGRTAEIVRDYVQKGSRIYIEGKLRTRSWDDKETGQRKYRTEVVIRDSDLILLSFNNVNGQSNGNGNGATHEPRTSSQQQPDYEYSQAGDPSDDIPF